MGVRDNNPKTKNKEKRRPLLTVPQFLIVIAVLVALWIALVFNSRALTGREMGANEAALASRLAEEKELNQQLIITLTYVHSDQAPADYARDEAGMILPGEKRVVPMPFPPPPTPTPIPTPFSQALVPSTPFKAWWMLFFDSSPPGR